MPRFAEKFFQKWEENRVIRRIFNLRPLGGKENQIPLLNRRVDIESYE